MKNEMKNEIENKFVGKYCIVRTRIAGLICGTVVDLGLGFVELKDARRIHRPISKSKELSWYEGVAQSGLCEEKGLISGAVDTKLIVEDYELNVCSDEATESLKNFAANTTTY